MKKILYVTNGINGSGGLERVLSIKASALAEDYGYEVHILVLNDAYTRPFYSFSHEIKVHSISVAGSLLGYFKAYRDGLRNTVNEIKPDLIAVCDDGLKGFVVPRLLSRYNIPIVYERHASIHIDQQFGIKARLMQVIMRKWAAAFDAFVVLTQNNIKEWRTANIKVIPNPLTFYPEQSATLQSHRLIAVGAHSYNKGYDLLLSVWSNIQSRFPDWELHIYGRKDKDGTYTNMAKTMGVARVCFHEPVQDIMPCYLNAAIMVLPSRSEGFGMVLIEAMACGLPCVSFDCPSGPADIITDQADGFLIAPEDTLQMEERLLQLMSDEALRLRMGLAAKKNVQRFLPESIIRQWDELFKQLMR